MSFHPIQTNFSGGILSPRFHARVDAPVFGRALEDCVNWLIYPQGALEMRGGYGYVAPSVTPTQSYIEGSPFNPTLSPVRLFELPSRFKFYMIELTPGKLRLFDQNGLVQISNPQLIRNNLFARGLADWWVVAQQGTVITAEPSAARVYMTKPTANANGAITSRPDTTGYLRPSTSYDLKFTVARVGTVGRVRVRVQIDPAGTVLHDQTYLPGSYTVTFSTDATASFNLPVSFSPQDTGAQVYVSGIELRKTGAAATELTTPWLTYEQIEAIQTSYSAASDETFFVNGVDPPQHLLHPSSVEDQFLFEAVAFTNYPTADWRTGVWPSVVEVHQGRLWLGATADLPNALWGSKVNSLYDFNTDTGAPTAASGLSLRVATKGGIQWLRAQRSFLMGTVLGEYVIGSAGPAIVYNDYFIKQQSAFGSKRIQPYNVADQVMFVSIDGRKLRGMNYEWETDGWNALDLTFLSPELTVSGIKDITFARDPLELVIATLADGTAAVCTYNKASEVTAWWKATTDGFICSHATSFYQSGVVWAAIARQVGTNWVVSIEKISLDTGSQFLDSSLVRPVDDLSVPPGAVTGLGHLEGRTVRVIVDGALETDKVVTGGTIYADNVTGATAIVGLGYTVRAVSLPTEGGNPSGTAQGVMKGRSRIWTRIYGSALPLVNGRRVQEDRTPSTPMGRPEVPRTGDFLVANLGLDRFSQVTIEQDLPVKTRIAGFFGRTTANPL
jgi:hypothetical protein